MEQQPPPATTSSGHHPWSDDTVFQIVGDPFRCQVLASLAGGEMKTPVELNAGSGRKRHAYLKHLSIMCKAGILVQRENPRDRRQPLYALGPGIVVSRTPEMISLDLGACVLKFPRGKSASPASV